MLILAGLCAVRVASDERARHDGARAAARRRRLSALAIIAVPLALTMELAAQSNRPAIDLDGALRGSLHPASLLTLVSANLFGTDGPLTDFWGPPSAAFGVKDLFLARNMGDVYLGALPLASLLAAFAGRSRPHREMCFFAGAAVALTLYALGRFSPAFAVMFHFPGVDLFRRPADATFPLCAVLAILAGYGFHRVRSGTASAAARALAGDDRAARARRVRRVCPRIAAALPLAFRSRTARAWRALAFVVIAVARRLSCARALLGAVAARRPSTSP